jgi:CheY-like chemotaxis protein
LAAPAPPTRVLLVEDERDGFHVVAALRKEPGWRDIPVIVIASRDLDPKDREKDRKKDHERLNSGVQSALIRDTFRPADLVEHIRPPVRPNPVVNNDMESAS